MVMKAVVHVPTGEFKNKAGQFECHTGEPHLPVLSVTNGVTTYDPDYDVVVVSRMPDPRTEKYGGTPEPAAKTEQDIATYDATQPKYIDVLKLIEALDGSKADWFSGLKGSGARIRLMLLAAPGGRTNVNGDKFKAGWAWLKARGVQDAIWADAAAADAWLAAVVG